MRAVDDGIRSVLCIGKRLRLNKTCKTPNVLNDVRAYAKEITRTDTPEAQSALTSRKRILAHDILNARETRITTELSSRS